MVGNLKYYLVLFVFLTMSFFSQTVYAASLTASVDRNQVAVGQSFTLELTLAGASPKGGPDISALNNDFTIYGTSQSSQTTIVNNEVNSSINWHITLIPKKDGDLRIPAFSVDSDAGTLKSEPVSIKAGKPSSMAANDNGRFLYASMEVAKRNPYKNEPVLLSAKLVASKSISDIAISDLTIPDAIVENQGEPQIYDSVVKGQRVKVVEARYLITPLKSGAMKIPAIVFQGKAESGKERDQMAGSLGGRRFGDPFGMFNDFGGFANYEPFALAGDEVTLDVKAPASDVQPWLPAGNVQIMDEWTSLDNAKVGEPLTRKVMIVAQGLTGAGLPSLEGFIDPDGHFKIYADNPTTGDNLEQDGTSVNGWREEIYTLIPQSEGSVTVPEIKLAWWDVNNNKLSYATVPAKTINIGKGKGAGAAGQPVVMEESKAEPQPSAVPESQAQEIGDNNAASMRLAYMVLAVMGVLVVIMGGTIIYMFRKMESYRKQALSGDKLVEEVTYPANEDKISISGIEKAKNVDELRDFVQKYASQHWKMQKNASLRSIADYISKNNPQMDVNLLLKLDEMLYSGGKVTNIAGLGKDIQALIKAVGGYDKNSGMEEKKFAGLNPS